MWNKHYVGQDLTGFADNGQFHAVSRVTLVIDDENSVTAGDDTGIELQAECPFATQAMADAVLEQIQGYQYRAYSADEADIDPAAELGDGVTAGGLYSVIARVDDGGTGYPSLSAPGEVELQDEYPVVGPATQEMNRRIESVKKWAEENNHDLQQELETQMEQAGKLITGQLGGHYIVTMNPEDGTPNGWAEMDTDSVETAKNIWMMTMGGLGFYPNGINSTPNVALTMDGKINASMILTGELWANLIKSGRIESQQGEVYFDLDANNGKGELAASVLKGVDEGIATEARIGEGQWAGGSTYQGLKLAYPGELGGSLVIAIDDTNSAYTQANKADIAGTGDLNIRSNAHVNYSGGSNVLDFYGNSATGEGTVVLKRGTKNKTSKNVFYADTDLLLIQYDDYNGGYIQLSDAISSFNAGESQYLRFSDTSSSFHAGENQYLQFSDTFSSFHVGENKYLQFSDTSSIFRAGENQYLQFTNTGCVLFDKSKIEFGTNGYMRASIESNGDARFGNIYSNGTLVTSDREKKTDVKKLYGSFLDKIKGSQVYQYRLKHDEVPAAENVKEQHTRIEKETVGLMYDEAPEEIRSESERGEKAINLYSMVSLLWKAVQELSEKVEQLTDSMKEE